MIWMLVSSEFHSIIAQLFPEWIGQDASSWFWFDMPKGWVTAGWFIREAEAMLNSIIICVMLNYVAYMYSWRLYCASLIYTMHQTINAVMFFVNFQRPVNLYWWMAILGTVMLW